MDILSEKNSGKILSWHDSEITVAGCKADHYRTDAYSGDMSETNISEIDDAYIVPRYISKFLVINRVVAAGKFADAMTALGGPGSLQYELWSAAQELDANDDQVRGLIVAIGLDPAEVLA
jgi:hypothetical protein